MLRKLTLSITVLIIGIVAVSAQSIKLSGKVSDEVGIGLPGVNILIKGTLNGTVSDVDGNYSFSPDVKNGDIILFTCIGYNEQEVRFDSKRTIYNVSLTESAEFLEDVVVVGYGTQKKANLTGAVASMKLDDVKDIPVSNTAALLQGRMTGVTVTNFSAQPGVEDLEIRIRGIGTLNNANPLILIDGVEGNLNNIPAEDIESISVLKDAASASIYGVRAANGVILVTTKRGSGSPTITYSGSVGVQNATKIPSFIDSWQWAQLFNEENEANGDITGNYTDEMIQKLRTGSDPDYFSNTNWLDVIFRTAVMHKHHLSLNGGNDKSHYMASIGYLNQEGIMKGTDSNRGNFRVSADTKVYDILTLGVSTSGSYQRASEPQCGIWELFNSAANHTRPTIPTYYSNGQYGAYDGNPFFTNYSRTSLYEVSKPSYTDSYKFDGKAYVTVEPVKNLKISSSFAYQFYLDKGQTDSQQSKFYRADGSYTVSGIPILYDNESLRTQWIQENTISYDFSIADSHNFSFLLGQSCQMNSVNENNQEGQYFLSDYVHVMDAAQITAAYGRNYKASLRSFFGRINYNYKNRYLLEANLRRDESSRIPPHNRAGYFPSFSVGWNIGEEQFMKSQHVIDVLKLRGSWGKLGNQEIGYYPYQTTYSIGQDNYIWGTEKIIGAAASKGANSDISWEVSTTLDFGLDIELFDHRFQASFDYFDKLTSGILLQLPVSALLGVEEAAYVNAAEVSNRGWELSLGYRDHWGNWTFGANVNLSHVKNNIENVNGREDWVNDWTINVAGAPIGAYYGYVADGLYRSQSEIDETPVSIGAPRVGDIKYVDTNEDGEITDADRVIIGNPFPKLSYGINLNASWKNLDLSLFFQGVSGVDRIFLEYPTISGGALAQKLDRYHETRNPNGNYPALGNNSYNSTPSSFWIGDASYCRLKNIEIGYRFPRVLKGMRVYVSGQNLLTFTKVKDYDPEKYASDRNNANYPNARVMTLGLNINF